MIKLTKEDFDKAQKIWNEERISPVDEQNMFLAGLYCILSATESYKRHTFIYKGLLAKDLDNPESITNNKQRLDRAVRKTRFPNVKARRIYDFASWWPQSDLPGRIVEDVHNGRKDEFNLRNQFADEAPGLWYKGASLLMIKCGYENVVPIDLWVMRFLKDCGYEVEIPDYEKKSGPRPKKYMEYERIISGMARRRNVSPSIFQFAVWGRYSSWNKTSRQKPYF
jgi:thermostable 8-oxoguanine DNA glycosylase